MLRMLEIFSRQKIIIGDYVPTVTLFVPVFNEEKIIRKKIENSIGIDYPKEKIEIVFYSDNSSDETDQIINEYIGTGIKLYRADTRRGKNYLINNSFEKMNGDIIVFSDANSLYRKDAIKLLVRNFKDQTVGCVCGKLVYISDANSLVGKGESLYFKYESTLKRLESVFGSVVTGNGAIYAIRKNLLSQLPEEVPNDFAHPIEIKAKGFKVIYEPLAIAEERATVSTAEEFRRRVRIVLRSFTAFIFYQKKYNILKNSYSFFFISHKLLRWFIFPLMVLIFFINLSLNGYYANILLYIQCIFYISALIGFICQKMDFKIKVFYIPFYFCLINLAGALGILKYFIGKKEIMWDIAETTR
ncbi:MAG: glycosyltransferase family 2 protein [Candidatus Schekmanbacteria bacterium]|nr:glycosyltransferase family 2 protein [Candidatus Schekmanbacteria bacterium]